MTVDHILFNKIKWVKESAYIRNYIGMKTTTNLDNVKIDNLITHDTTDAGTFIKLLAGAVVFKQEITDDDDVKLYIYNNAQYVTKDSPWAISLKANPQVLGALA